MQQEITQWLSAFREAMCQTFAGRVVFLGIQGSYRRGEAHAGSDVDLVAVLDRLDLPSIRQYRELVRFMPFGDLACGFLCGAEDFKRWPEYDRFHLWCDTFPLYGTLDAVLPAPTRQDAWRAVQIGTANLYHAVCHTAAFEQEPEKCLPALYKETFFVLRAAAFARGGTAAPNKKSLLWLLSGTSRQVLVQSMQMEQAPLESAEAERCFSLLLQWCQEQLAEATEALAPSSF